MRTIRTIALAVSFLLPAASLANGYSVPNVAPRDLALAGSAVAAQRDAGAVYANPAALARLEGPNVAVVVPLLDIAASWDAAVGPAEESTKLKLAPPGAAFVAYGGKAGGFAYGVGAGFNVPFGGNVFWEKDWEGRFLIQTVDRKIYAGYLNGGVAVTPWLRLGAGAIYYRTTEYLEQAFDFMTNEGYAELSTSGGAFSYQLALEAQIPGAPVTFAVDYKHKATQKLEGRAAFHGVPAALRPSLPDQDATHVLTLPNVLDVALAWQAREDLLVTLAFTMDRYSVYTEDLFVGSAGTEVLVPRDYGDGYTFRGGVEYRLSPEWEIRGGLLRDISGAKEENFSPSLPDASSWAGSVGASWNFRPGMALHAGLFVALMDEVDVRNDPDLPGTYDIRAEIFSVGFTWRPR